MSRSKSRRFGLDDLKPGSVLEGPSNCYVLIIGWEDWSGHEDVLFGIDYLGRKHHFWNDTSLKGFAQCLVGGNKPNVGAFTGAVRRNQKPNWTAGDERGDEQCHGDQPLSEASPLDRPFDTIGVGSSTLFGGSIGRML